MRQGEAGSRLAKINLRQGEASRATFGGKKKNFRARKNTPRARKKNPWQEIKPPRAKTKTFRAKKKIPIQGKITNRRQGKKKHPGKKQNP